MRTRTLLLLAIACGVVILTAGVVQLLRVAGEDDETGASKAVVGEATAIGDLSVTVETVRDDGAFVDVTITIGGADDADGTDRFRLVVASPPALEPVVVDGDDGEVPVCAGTTSAPQRCRLRFELPSEPGTSRVLNLRRGEEAVNWVLSDP